MAYNRKQRLNDNIKAIETAFILDREQRTPTARERLLLERYCGFGGLKCILNPARELADAVHWAKSDLELFAPTVELHRLIRKNSKNEDMAFLIMPYPHRYTYLAILQKLFLISSYPICLTLLVGSFAI